MDLTRKIWKLVQSPAVVFVVAVSVRLGAAWQLLPEKAGIYFYRNNEPSRIAWALVSGHGYSSPWPNTPLLATAQQPPGYPLLLAAIFRVFGAYSLSSLWTAVALNAVFAALTAITMLQIGMARFGTPVGVLAAWVWSCWLYEAAVSIRLWESALSALCLSIVLLLLPAVAASTRASRWLGFGLLAGVAVLTNTTLLALVPFFWLWLWISCRGQGRSCNRWLLGSVAMCVLVLTPWTIRNYIAFHRVIPLRDNFGLEFWVGNHEDMTSRDFPLFNPAEYNRLGEIQFMEAKRQDGLQFVRQHPLQFCRSSLRRAQRFWTEPQGSAWRWISPLAWLGGFLAIRRKGIQAAEYLVVLLIFPLVYYITHTFPTYRHPIEPVILLLGAYATVTVSQRVATVRSQSPLSSASHGLAPTASSFPPGPVRGAINLGGNSSSARAVRNAF
ncbi:MAG TPA: glycosyltransferase family 39 protein [Terriglobales bacterium]|nr:glycosyltransferase family 39 protein [Terriglobales bacterium]